MDIQWMLQVSSKFFQVLVILTVAILIATFTLKDDRYSRGISIITVLSIFLWVAYISISVMLILKG